MSPRSGPRGLGATGGKRKSGVERPPREVEDEDADDGDDRPAALLCDRLRLITGRLVVVRSGEDADKTMGGGLSVAESIGEIAGISMSGTPRFDRTSRYVEADLPRAVDFPSVSDDADVGASPRGIPGPRGGRRSRLRSNGDGGGSLSLTMAGEGFERGVDEAGGKTKLACFAVCGSSRVGSGVVRFLDGLRPRAGMLSEGLAKKSSEGISNVGMRNGSGGGRSP